MGVQAGWGVQLNAAVWSWCHSDFCQLSHSGLDCLYQKYFSGDCSWGRNKQFLMFQNFQDFKILLGEVKLDIGCFVPVCGFVQGFFGLFLSFHVESLKSSCRKHIHTTKTSLSFWTPKSEVEFCRGGNTTAYSGGTKERHRDGTHFSEELLHSCCLLFSQDKALQFNNGKPLICPRTTQNRIPKV